MSNSMFGRFEIVTVTGEKLIRVARSARALVLIQSGRQNRNEVGQLN